MSTYEQLSSKSWLNRSWPPLTVAAVVSVAVLILMRETPWPFDPMFYMDNAEFFTGGRASLALEHRSLRWGLMLPLGVLHVIFGYSEAAYYGIPIAAIALLALSAFVLSRRLMGPWWSCAAAVLVVANPLILSRSSHPFPDTLATALVTLGIGGIAWLSQEERTLDYWLAGGAGILFGLAYAVREVVAPVFAPIIVLLLILLRVKARYWFLIASGALLIFLMELGLMNAWFDDPLARLRILLYRDDRTVEESSSNLEKIQRINAFQGTLGLSATAMFRKWGEVGLGVAPIVGLGGLIASSLRRDDDRAKRVWLSLIVWLVVGWLMFVAFGLWRSSDGVPVLNLTQVRYWYLLIPPVGIGVVGLLRTTGLALARTAIGSHRQWPLVTAGVACGLLCLGMIAASWGNRLQVVAGWDHMSEFREWLVTNDHDRDVIAARHRTMRVADMYDNTTLGANLWNGRLARLHTADGSAALMISTEDARSDLFLLDGRQYDTSAPPVEWDLQFVSSDGMMAILSAEDLEDISEEPKPVLGPDLPLRLEVGTYRTWRPAEPTGGPYRYRVAFSGGTPVARCGWESDDGRESAPALFVGDGVMADDLRHLDVYCPARSGDTWLALAAMPASNTEVNQLVVVNDEIIEVRD